MLHPAWPSEKPGFDKNEQFKLNASKGDPDGNLQEIRAYLEGDATDKKAIVLNKLNFQSEFGISSDMNFNQFFIINVTKNPEPIAITKASTGIATQILPPDGKQLIFFRRC